MTNNEMIAEFSDSSASLDSLQDMYLPQRKKIQADFDAVVQVEWKKLFPRNKFTMLKAHGSVPGFMELRKPFEVLASELSKIQAEERKSIAKRMDELAGLIVVDRTDMEKSLWSHYGSRSTSDYHTQGFGAAKYARAAAEDLLEHAKMYVDAEIREVHREPTVSCGYSMESISYDVYAACSETLCEIIQRKDGPSLRDTVKRLWSNGVNPRVSMPMLPHGYEASVGLDYFGREVVK